MSQTESPSSNQTPSRSPRRWFRFSLRRFSLRTLLLVVTAIALLFGLWIIPSERQRRFYESLSELGGQLSFDGDDPEVRRQYHWYEHYYRNITSVDHVADFSDSRDERYAKLDWASVPKLKSISFGNLITLEVNKIIPNLPNSLLEFRANMSLDDESIRLISQLSELRTIEISTRDVTDLGLNQLSQLKKLQSFSFGRFILYSLNEADQNLSEEELVEYRKKHGEILCDFSVLNDLHNLEKLRLDNVTLTGLAIENICKLKNIKELDLRASRFGNTTISKLALLPNLKRLKLTTEVFYNGIPSRDLLQLKNFAGLEVLEVNESLSEEHIINELKRALPKLQVKVSPDF